MQPQHSACTSDYIRYTVYSNWHTAYYIQCIQHVAYGIFKTAYSIWLPIRGELYGKHTAYDMWCIQLMAESIQHPAYIYTASHISYIRYNALHPAYGIRHNTAYGIQHTTYGAQICSLPLRLFRRIRHTNVIYGIWHTARTASHIYYYVLRKCIEAVRVCSYCVQTLWIRIT